MDDSMFDLEDFQVERDLQAAGIDAMRRARRFGACFVIEEEGKTKLLKPEETPPYEKLALENLERLNRKIEEWKKAHPESLNEEPPRS